MAQLAEHVIGNDEVISSNLITSSKHQPKRVGAFVFSEFTSRQENDTNNAGMAQLAEHVICNKRQQFALLSKISFISLLTFLKSWYNIYENGSPATQVDVLTPRCCAPFSFLF